MSGVMDERQLFEIEAPPPVSLADAELARWIREGATERRTA
jgi:hypothetical protein